MSKTVDAERREIADEERHLRSKARLQLAQAILRGAVEKQSQAQVAKELGVSREWLELVERLFGMRALRRRPGKNLAKSIRSSTWSDIGAEGSIEQPEPAKLRAV